MNTASQQLHQLQKQVSFNRNYSTYNVHCLVHVNDPALDEDEVDGVCAAGGARGQDADKGRSHNATSHPAPLHLNPTPTSSFSQDARVLLILH